MPNTRFDPDGDFDGVVPRDLSDGPVERPRTTPVRSSGPKRSTSADKNLRARTVEEAHGHRDRLPLDPSIEALDAMTPEQREETLAHIRAVRAAYESVGEAAVAGTKDASVQDIAENAEPEDLDPGRPF